MLFCQSLDLERYHHVLTACALDPDIKNLPAGDLTEIGEKVRNVNSQRWFSSRNRTFSVDVLFFSCSGFRVRVRVRVRVTFCLGVFTRAYKQYFNLVPTLLSVDPGNEAGIKNMSWTGLRMFPRRRKKNTNQNTHTKHRKSHIVDFVL